MSRHSSFGLLTEISKEQFLDVWQKEDQSSGHPDQFMDQRRAEHAEYEGLRYYITTLTEHGLTNVIIGHHLHHGIERARAGGEPLWDVVSRYQPQDSTLQADTCLLRLQRISQELDAEFQKTNPSSEPVYGLGRVFHPRGLAVPGDYFRDYGHDKLYAGNFHRFVGYGRWIKQNGFKPLTIYYCENPRF